MNTVRFAPSPTGHLHIGGVRTALYNYLYAKHAGGAFILRIDDTDSARSEKRYVDEIKDSLTWLGLEWDSIFFQSQRTDKYLEACDILMDQGLAFMSDEGTCVFNLKKRDSIGVYHCGAAVSEMSSEDIGNFVLLRSDGSPTYHLSCAVDDMDLGIGHVIRGNDHAINDYKQVAIIEALGKVPPRYIHLPMIVNSNGKKLSKRDDAASILYYRDRNYLPEALLNYLLRLGWSHGDKETFTMQEMIDLFNISKVGKSPAAINTGKLDWLNRYHIRKSDNEYLLKLVTPILSKWDISVDEKDSKLLGALEIVKTRSKSLQSMAHMVYPYLIEDVPYSSELVNKFFTSKTKPFFLDLFETLEGLSVWNKENLDTMIKTIANRYQVKTAEAIQPLRVCLTGDTVSPSIYDVMILLGQMPTLHRIRTVYKNIKDM